MQQLHNQRYEQIKESVVATFEKYGVDQYPIDCFSLAKQMGFIVVPFSKLDDEQLKAIRFCEGEAIMFIVNDVKYIFYNDINNNSTRQRFSIFHELGHYVLGHKAESELARLEANFFASYAIAPLPLVWKTKCDTILKICNTFDVSVECATKIIYNLENWQRVTKTRLSDYEVRLLNLFNIKGESHE